MEAARPFDVGSPCRNSSLTPVSEPSSLWAGDRLGPSFTETEMGTAVQCTHCKMRKLE